MVPALKYRFNLNGLCSSGAHKTVKSLLAESNYQIVELLDERAKSTYLGTTKKSSFVCVYV